MNWKFWQRKNGAQGTARPTRYFQTPRILTEAEQQRANLERLLALADVGDANPVWKTLLSYADEHAANEQESALRPELGDAQRHYNAGRAASALDFALALRDLRTQAKLEAKKLQKEDSR
jgi:hypothetical protein